MRVLVTSHVACHSVIGDIFKTADVVNLSEIGTRGSRIIQEPRHGNSQLPDVAMKT